VTIAIVVGTRPEIIKMAPVVRACIARQIRTCCSIRTALLYEMDGVFFEDWAAGPAPQPVRGLGIAGLASWARS
jgi:UDP-N-acetylglucosamine 2-epimerase (non-hydrolysing)